MCVENAARPSCAEQCVSRDGAYVNSRGRVKDTRMTPRPQALGGTTSPGGACESPLVVGLACASSAVPGARPIPRCARPANSYLAVRARRTQMDMTERLRRLLGSTAARERTLGGFFDGLLQTFENCRAGLSDAQAQHGGEEVERFFTRLYEKEAPRLHDAIALHGAHLAPEARQQLTKEVDERVREVVVPAYVRLAAPITVRERNDFYLAPPRLHGLERLASTVAGMLVGAFIVWAPFIPIWSKELILVFGLGGLVFPELRRLFALRRYQSELNRLVARTDGDVARLELALFTGEVAHRKASEELARDEEEE